MIYEDDIIFKLEFISSGSEYPKGPYIGLPSYAHPIIGECPVIWLNSPLPVILNVFSKLVATFWE